MHKLVLIIIFSLFTNAILAQSDIPVGTWRTHNAYNKIVAISSTPNEVIAAVNSAIFLYEPVSGVSEQLTRLTGLSDSDITSVGYNLETARIIIAYRNGNLDFIDGSKIINFTDLLKAEIPDSKQVNHIYDFEEYSYLSTDFGVMILNHTKNEVKDSYFELGSNGNTIQVYSSTIRNDTLYLATEEGIIRGHIEANLKDFNNWLRYDSNDGMPISIAKIILGTQSGLIAAFDNEGIFDFNGNRWSASNQLVSENFISGNQHLDKAVLVTENGVFEYELMNSTEIISDLIVNPIGGIYLNNQLIIADNSNGLITPSNDTSFYPNGPFSNDIVKLFGYQDKMIGLPPAYSDNFIPLRNNNGFFMYDEGEWKNYNGTGYPNTIQIPEFLDISDAMYSYSNNKLYLSSFGYGIMELKDEDFKIFDDSNSSLININPPEKNVLVSALDANSKVLSAINFNSTAAHHQFDFSNESWKDNNVLFPASNAVQLLSFENNSFWLRISATAGGGIIIYDELNERELYITTELPNSNVNDMLIDREGKVWLATDRGVFYFINAEYLLDQGFIDPVQPIYDGQVLFRNDKLTALAVDGGNRIWMATTTGLWLFSNDGQVLENHFTVDNSPLPSSNILDISINHSSGEVFIATDQGLVSYRGSATISETEDPLKIFPNPVILSRHNSVTIQGVPNNAEFWITDSAGRLVYKSIANGNTAIWDGLYGRRDLSSGVYFVFVSTEDGSEKQVGKIALVN